ncbi:MAG: pirin family protein [Myxococcota bacterium]
MSYHDCPDSRSDGAADDLELVIVPRTRDLGGFEVARVLPSAVRRLVGPFIFFDRMGPSRMDAGTGMDVRPHPHIGLSTVTYLFDGRIMHRDSLGTRQLIEPGAVNWMTAGQGIAHSERSPNDARAEGPSLFGIQAWCALPKSAEETTPAFAHHPKDTLPVIEDGGVRSVVIAGHYAGERSPVAVEWDTLYVDAQMTVGTQLPIDASHEERAIFIVEGEIELGGRAHPAGEMLVLKPGVPMTVKALSPARLMLLGGATMDGQRYIWWNFVSSSKERIEQAKADWTAGRFDAVPDESEWIPLPDTPGP